MKRIYLIMSLVVLVSMFTSCEKFLTRDPQDKQTNDTFWQSEVSLRSYAQDFYSDFFRGYDADYQVFGRFSTGDDYVDDFITIGGGYTVFPVSNIDGYNNYHSYGWSAMYGDIYKANVMIEKIPTMKSLSTEAANHWMGVAKFFRAMAYSQLLKTYGGCPYFEKVTDPADADVLYKDRDKYSTVAANVLADYQFAIDNMRADDGKRQVNKYVAGAYMSRDMLYHGTWMKYHENASSTETNPLFQGAIAGAKVVKAGPYAIGNTYNALFSVDDLAGNPEVIFYREYTYGLQSNSVGIYGRREDARGGVTEDAIEAYLCADGLPIGQSPLYKNIKNNNILEGALLNRDPRIYETMADSLRIMGAIAKKNGNYTVPFEGKSPTGFCCKKFVNEEWYLTNSPFVSGTGQSPADAPVMRYAEVLLNYAEAAYESGSLNQGVLDETINLIRKRNLGSHACLPSMVLAGGAITANGVAINDPARDQSVDPVLWEIRRERRIEMMQEGRRCEDLRRWAKFSYLNSEDKNGNPSMSFLGAFIDLNGEKYSGIEPTSIQLFDPSDPTNTAPSKGYLKYGYRKGMRVFDNDKYYLKAIPVSEIVKYKDKGYKLTQNPGWE